MNCFLKQKISARSLIAMLISFSGVFFISSQGGQGNFKPEHITGVLLALGSSVIWSFFWILNVKDKKDEAVKLFLNFFFVKVIWINCHRTYGAGIGTDRNPQFF